MSRRKIHRTRHRAGRRAAIALAGLAALATLAVGAFAWTGGFERAGAVGGPEPRSPAVPIPTSPAAPPTADPTPAIPDPSTDRPAEPEPAKVMAPASLRTGARGPAVLDLQRRLDELGYTVTSIDGLFGLETHHALVAFQKVNGLARDGVAGPKTRAALDDPVRPRPRSRGPGFHVEVDIARQVLHLVRDGRITETFDASTGSGETYVSRGATAVAVTPTGAFAVERKIDGWRESHLGLLYRPAYFVGGYAIHGSTSVPPYPASHGCVRVTLEVMDLIYDRLPLGTPVVVY